MTPPAASHAHAAPPLAPRRRTGPPPGPRRVSGPARRPAPAAPRGRGRRQGGLALGLISLAGRLDALASHRLLDRLIRSRVWIGIVAFALIGIVTLQLGLLKLNSGIGRSLEREATLQSQNAALSLENSELSAGSRVESQAEALGMRLVSVGGLQFLGSHARSDISRAAAALAAARSAEAASTATAASSGSSEEGSHEASGEEGSEASSEGSSEAASGGEASESSASSAAASESAAPSAGTEAAVETSSEAAPAGESGGAAAPGG